MTTKEQNIDFLIEAYKIRAKLYSDLTTRMWIRFNYLLTASTALFGLFFTVWMNSDSPEGVFWFPIVGIIISALWFILGAQDRYYFEGFRNQTRQVEAELSKELNSTNLQGLEFGSANVDRTNLLTWRWKRASLSRLPAIVPLFFVFLWYLLKK